MECTEVPRTIAPPPDVFEREYVRRARPVVLAGMFDARVRAEWTPERLRTVYGGAPVSVARTRGSEVVIDPVWGLVQDVTPLGTFLDAAGTAGGYVMARAEDLPAALRDELPVPPYCADARWRVTKLWIAAGETVASLHRDLSDNLHTVITGEKFFTLVSPEQSDFVYPNGLFSSIPNGARIDPERPDFERFPLSKGLRPWGARVGPGDTLFIPHGWWHHVRTVPGTITVNTFWAKGARGMVVMAADVFKRLRGISR